MALAAAQRQLQGHLTPRQVVVQAHQRVVAFHREQFTAHAAQCVIHAQPVAAQHRLEGMDERRQLLQAAFHARGLQAGLIVEANLAGGTHQRGDRAACTRTVTDRRALRPAGKGFHQGDVMGLLAGRIALLVAQVLHTEVAHRLRGLAHGTGLASQLAVEAALQFGTGIGRAQCGQHRQQLVTQRQLGQGPLAVALGPGLLQALVLAGWNRQLCIADQIVLGQAQGHRLHRRNRFGCRPGRIVGRFTARGHGQQQHDCQPPSTRRPSSHCHAHALGLPGPVRILRPAR